MQSLLGRIPYNNVYISYLSYLSYHLSCVTASAHCASAPLTPVVPLRLCRHMSCRSALLPVVSPSHCHESCPRCCAATHHVMLLWALRPDVGGWVTLSPRYWAGRPSNTDGGQAPYSVVPNGDPSWSSKLARCLMRQCKRICAKAE